LVNVSGSTVEEYISCAEQINDLEHITGIELNISCPNVKEGGMAFGTSCPAAEAVVDAVRKVYKKHMMVKLSPNVTDIAEIAKAVEGKGADSISLINTILAMAINAESRKPVLSTITGGLSGPAIKPIALRMVWQVANAVKVPVVGMGGIMNATDAIEFFLAGASAIQVGTANFIDPTVTQHILTGIDDYLQRHNYTSIREIIGCLQM
jgi:dihydroorotate dehydrogenase (NAD+) catalytic subunit